MATYLVVHSDLSSPNNDVELVVMLAFCETLSLRSSISKTRTINCISEGGVNFLQLITSTCHDKTNYFCINNQTFPAVFQLSLQIK